MYKIKSIDDLKRCISLNDGLPLSCYCGSTKEIIIDFRVDGTFLITYETNGKTYQHTNKSILNSVVGKNLKNRTLATYSITTSGVIL